MVQAAVSVRVWRSFKGRLCLIEPADLMKSCEGDWMSRLLPFRSCVESFCLFCKRR